MSINQWVGLRGTFFEVLYPLYKSQQLLSVNIAPFLSSQKDLSLDKFVSYSK